MKIHNLSVIFVIIAIPLILITSYYISLQIDTINMQTAYDAKLLDSTKEAIDAFEINTVQWNSSYSETADSKRRDIMASINTFINSFANNTGVGGTNRDYIMAYMPAIAYTLYDGYYIYSPANEKVALTDDNGVGIVMTEELSKQYVDDSKTTKVITGSYSYEASDEGKLLYEVEPGKTADGKYNGKDFTLDINNAREEYKHILKPFASYSEKIGNWVINYTLDNYVTIYGNIDVQVSIGEAPKQEFIYKAGYLNLLDSDKGIKNIKSNTIQDIQFMGKVIKPEELRETIAYKYSENGDIQKIENCPYVYECEGNTKVYFDNNDAFIVNSKQVRTNLADSGIKKYKKITIPQSKGGSELSYVEIYQNLVDGKWYTRDTNGQFKERDTVPTFGGVDYTNKELDYSATNYCVESYIVTRFINSLTASATNKLMPNTDAEGICTCGYKHTGNNPLSINTSNNPELENSDFYEHKRGIIKKVVEENLNQAITSYSRKNKEEYKLPKLTETDWDQILKNVSIITFIQNIPIGMKYYNNYAIATSTVNKEYVDPDEIYLNATDGEYQEYYHKPYCKKLGQNDLKGYRSIDYLQQSYEYKNPDTNETETAYYYKHTKAEAGKQDLNQACYYCLVQPSLYEEVKIPEKETAYDTALARERYIARMAKLPAAGNPTVFAVGYSARSYQWKYSGGLYERRNYRN